MEDPIGGESETNNTQNNAEATKTGQTQDIQSEEHGQAVEKTSKDRKFLKFVAIVLLVVVMIGAGVFYCLYKNGDLTNNKQQMSASTNPGSVEGLVAGYTFIKYTPNSEYDKYDPDDSRGNVRADSFHIQLVRNGMSHPVTLGKNIMEFGRSVGGGFYALGCTPVAAESVGAENQTFSLTFYDVDGKVASQQSFQQRSADAPFVSSASSLYCNDGFELGSSIKVSPNEKIGYGQQKIDDLNYDIYVTNDGKKREIARENTKVVDIPLAMSPDKRILFYDQVSSKRTEISCGGEVKLPYKIPNYDGSINDLHMVDLTTGTDKNLGPEKSFSTESYPISLSLSGTFTPGGERYFLQTGVHHGCGDGVLGPIHLPYINVPSGEVGAITSSKSLGYNDSCISPNGDFALLYKESDEDKDFIPSPTIVNLANSKTFRLHNSYKGFDDGSNCAFNRGGADVFVNTLPAQSYSNSAVVINAIRILDPAVGTVKDIKLTTPINIKDAYMDDIQILPSQVGGYISLSRNSQNGYDQIVTTIFFDAAGHTKTVPVDLLTF